MESLTDPSVFGPGKWDDLQTLAMRADDKKGKIRFDEDVRFIAKNLKCGDCKTDFLAYIEKNPPLKKKMVIEEGKDVTMFYWVYEAHDHVNRKLGKTSPEFNIIYRFYYHSEGCESGCGEKVLPENVKKVLNAYLSEGKYVEEF
jgi:Erv1 / Alr family